MIDRLKRFPPDLIGSLTGLIAATALLGGSTGPGAQQRLPFLRAINSCQVAPGCGRFSRSVPPESAGRAVWAETLRFDRRCGREHGDCYRGRVRTLHGGSRLESELCRLCRSRRRKKRDSGNRVAKNRDMKDSGILCVEASRLKAYTQQDRGRRGSWLGNKRLRTRHRGVCPGHQCETCRTNPTRPATTGFCRTNGHGAERHPTP
jgi:hypothetical protein